MMAVTASARKRRFGVDERWTCDAPSAQGQGITDLRRRAALSAPLEVRLGRISKLAHGRRHLILDRRLRALPSRQQGKWNRPGRYPLPSTPKGLVQAG